MLRKRDDLGALVVIAVVHSTLSLTRTHLVLAEAVFAVLLAETRLRLPWRVI